MKLRTILTLNGIVATAYAISFLLIPKTVLSLYGMTQGPSEILTGQYFGVALLAIGGMTWLARNITDSETQRALILALLISDVVGLVVSVQGTLSGVMSSFGWTAVGIYLVFTLGYAYFQFKKPGAS